MLPKHNTHNGIPRWLDALLAGAGLLLSSPLLLICALAVWITSGRPVLFRQERVGLGGHGFTLYKFRSMRVQNDGPRVTRANDERITPFGRILRTTKLDELPELWNIVRGDMSLVGPRPEVPNHVKLSDPLWQEVLSARPGLTDPVTIRLRNEEHLLASVDGDRERAYIEVLLPRKMEAYAAYLRKRSFGSDLLVLWHTLLAILLPNRVPAQNMDEVLRDLASHTEQR